MKRGRTLHGASCVSGLTSRPAGRGKLDNAPLSAALNLSMSKISGITWAVGTYSRTRSQRSFGVCRSGVAASPPMTTAGWSMILHGIPCSSER